MSQAIHADQEYKADLTNLTARLDRLPWGRFHTVLVIALGFGWMGVSSGNLAEGAYLSG
ncbi:MAG TPA: hypothetical protein VGN34_02050 [Ktedonobacteraceae bacterium]